MVKFRRSCTASDCKGYCDVDNDEKEIREYPAGELRFKSRKKKKDAKLSKEEFAQLKALEEKMVLQVK